MFRYRLKRMPKRKVIIWSTLILLFFISVGSIARYYALSSDLSNNWSSAGIVGETVYVNDLEADWNYYIGLNFTEVTSKTVLPGENTNKYNSNTLVAVQLTYDGHDVNDNSLVGLVSRDERQHTFVYYKYYPVVDGKIKIELIDNPYTARPDGKGFNGWVCDKDSTEGVSCDEMTFSYDDDYYLRYLEVDAPAADANGDKKLIINLKASWTDADVKTTYTQRENFNDKSMQPINRTTNTTTYTSYVEPFSFTSGTYYDFSSLKSVANGEIFSGYLFDDGTNINENSTGTYDIVERNNYTCDYDTCLYIDTNDATASAKPNAIFLKVNNGQVNVVDSRDALNTTTHSVTNTNSSYFKDGDTTSGYFYVTNYNSTGRGLYYNNNGTQCTSGSCYKLIHNDRETITNRYTLQGLEKYTDAASCETTIDKWKTCVVLSPKVENGYVVYKDDGTGNYQVDYEDKTVVVNNPSNYRYFVTRDTNIMLFSSGTTSLSNLASSKPYTVTSSYTDAPASSYYATTNNTLELKNDMVIENIKYSGITTENSTDWYGNIIRTTDNMISSAGYNLKIGRNVVQRNNNSNSLASGISGDRIGKVIVESGNYVYLRALYNTSNGTPENVRMLSVYGSDYDRVNNNNTKLNIYLQAVASDASNWNSNSIVPTSEIVVKSGMFGSYILNGGTDSEDYYIYGIYAGALSNGSSTSFRTLKVEGGRIFSINGGPCIYSNVNGNVIGIYMTGGEVDNIVGGAGRSETQGNRIVSVTGGIVNNSVAGGSNSYEGGNGDGRLSGDTLVYIGGNAHLGGIPAYPRNGGQLYAIANRGSVFGAGLGNQRNAATTGVVNNSHVIINGGTIDGNVYGGGNYGSTGTRTQNSDTIANIELLSGTINGSVFGGANSANGGYTDDNSGSYTRILAKDYYYREDSDAAKFNVSVNYTSDISRTCRYNNRFVRINNGSCQNSRNGNNWSTDNSRMTTNPATDSRETGRTTGFTNYPNGYYLLDGTPTSSSMVCNVDNADSYETTTGTENPTWPNTNPQGYNSVTQNGTSTRTDTVTYSCYYINPSKIVKAGSILPTTTGRTYYEKMPDGSFREVTSFEYESSEITNNYRHSVDILLNGSTVNGSVYGGSNTTGIIYGNVNINLVSGSVQNVDNGVYGGGKGQSTEVRGHTQIYTNTIDDNSLRIYDIYGGSENGSVNGGIVDGGYWGTDKEIIGGHSLISINGGTITNVYGGGKGPNNIPVTYGSISVTLNDGIVNNIFGGTNIRGAVNSSNNPIVTINGGTVDDVFGGSNGQNASAEITKVIVNAGRINDAVYGGGRQAITSGTSNVTINGGTFATLDENGYAISGTTANVYGGGERAGVATTNVNIKDGANIYDVFGGSNIDGVVTTSNVNADDGNIMCNAYGGGNIAGVTTSNLNLFGSTFNYSLHEGEDIYTTSCGNAYGGGKSASVTNSNVKLRGSTLLNVYGGSNQDGVVSRSNIAASYGTAKTIFGGNNAGGSTVDSYIDYNENSGILNVDNVFGGSNGRGAISQNSTYVQVVNGTVNEDVYGGGNEAKVLGSTIVNVYGGTLRSAYGGGNSSFIGDAKENGGTFVEDYTGAEGSTRVNVVGGEINRNVYGSGNSSFVYGNTYVNLGDEAIADIKKITNLPVGTVYNPDNVTKKINVHGSVFGGSETNADESTQYDYTYKGVTGDATLHIDGTSYGVDLDITGSIYGSGNNSMTAGITRLYMNKYGLKNNPNVVTSIQRFSQVFINDSYLELLGARDRANATRYRYSLIRIDDLYILGSKSNGGTLNGTELYLGSGSTFLKEISSGYMDGAITSDNFREQTTTEQNGTLVNSGSDNKIYMGVNKVLAISDSEKPTYESNATTPGSVHGMTFLGMYINDNGNYVKGIYDSSYGSGDVVSSDVINQLSKSDYTFVYGKHDSEPDTQIKTNGYYSHYVDESGTLSLDYVGVTPTNTTYYKWVLGEESAEIVVDLQATRYSVEGAVNATINLEELIRQGASEEWHDAVLNITNVDTSGFAARVPYVKAPYETYLVDKTEIPFFNLDDNVGGVGDTGDGIIDSNQLFALTMGTSSTGWINNYKTNFYDKNYGTYDDFCDVNDNGDCVGDSIYIYDSTTSSRNLSFWLYYSKNLDFDVAERVSDDPLDITLGSVNIKTTLTNIYGDPTSTDSNKPINIIVNISMYEGDTDSYGLALAPGKKYDVFSNVQTDIASDGSFSLYQSMALDLNGPILSSKDGETWSADKLYNKAGTIVKNGETIQVSEAYRALNSSYVFPVGTKITMLDLINNEQYIYEVDNASYNDKVNEASANGGKVEYKLEDFRRMGNTDNNNKYDDDMNGEDSTKYRLKGKNPDGTDIDLAREEFIFSVDFSGVDADDRTKVQLNPYIYMSISRVENGTTIQEIMNPKGIPATDMDYRVYPDVNSTFNSDGGFVKSDGTLSSSTDVYKNSYTTLQLNTSLIQTDKDGNKLTNVSDTIYDDYKIGAKLTVWVKRTDENGNDVYENGELVYDQITDDLMDTIVTINGNNYYPQIDGTITIQLAGRITDVSSLINIDFSKSNLNIQEYMLKVETFASYDGMYYGDIEPIENIFMFNLLSNEFGLDVTASGEQLTHDVLTGEDINNSREIIYDVKTVSGVINPNLKISLERRTYDGHYDRTYESKDLKDLVESIEMSKYVGVEVLNNCYSYDSTGNCLYYNLGDIDSTFGGDSYTVKMTLKDGPTEAELANPNASGWKSGTYRVVFTMYDGDTPIGSVYEYLIIRSLDVNGDFEGS